MSPLELFNAHVIWVKILAQSYAKRRKLQFSDRQDVLNEGLLEMWLCARRFDQSRGSGFTSFAHRRVMGAFRDVGRRSLVVCRTRYGAQSVEYKWCEDMEQVPDHRKTAPPLTVGEILDFMPRRGPSRLVVMMAADGYERREIAKAFKKSIQWVDYELRLGRDKAIEGINHYFKDYIHLRKGSPDKRRRRKP